MQTQETKFVKFPAADIEKLIRSTVENNSSKEIIDFKFNVDNEYFVGCEMMLINRQQNKPISNRMTIVNLIPYNGIIDLHELAIARIKVNSENTLTQSV